VFKAVHRAVVHVTAAVRAARPKIVGRDIAVDAGNVHPGLQLIVINLKTLNFLHFF
jgi:hypothetical protein